MAGAEARTPGSVELTPALRAGLLALVPETPLNLETRSILLSDACEVFCDPADPASAVVRHQHAHLLAAVSRASLPHLQAAAEGLDGHWDLVAPVGELSRLAAALPDWKAEPALIYQLPESWRPESAAASWAPAADVRELTGPAPHLIDHLDGLLLQEITAALERRLRTVAAFEDGRPVAFCYSYRETETLWDVSIETLPEYQRRGLAAACALRLIDLQAAAGKQPVWGALESNLASQSLAAKLGFREAGRLAVLELVTD